MTPDLIAAEVAQFAADVQARAAALTDLINTHTPADGEPNDFLRYLTVAAQLLNTAATEIALDGLYVEPPPVHTDEDMCLAGA